MAELISLYVSLHAVFQNLVILVIINDKTMQSYQELQMSRKLEHTPRDYNCLSSRAQALTSGVLRAIADW